MKKITKTLVAVLLMTVMSLTNIVAFATEGEINPRLSHTDSGGFSFAVNENVGYIGVTSIFPRGEESASVSEIYSFPRPRLS